MTDRSQITMSEPVAWILEIQREVWDATGTRKTGELYTERKIVEDEADAQWYVNTLGWVAAPLYTHPPSERVRELVEAASALTVHSDGRGYFESGTACQRFREALFAITAEGLKEGG